jgi:hypothetical protein
MNKELVRVMADISAVNAEIEGMKAMNAVAALRNEYPVYTHDDFFRVSERLNILGQEAIQYG